MRLRRWLAFLLTCLMLLGLTGLASGSSHSFTITSPTSSSTWGPGSTVTITWTGGSGSTLVNLSLVDVPAWTVATGIASSIPNSGSYTWTVPPGVNPGTYLVYIENVERTVWAYGESFPIVKESDGKVDLAIAKKPEGTLQAGQTGAYLLAVSNIGTAAATGPVSVTDQLGAGLTFVSASGSGWTCSASGQTVTCIHPGPVPAGTSLPLITITVTVADDAEKVENCASVRLEKEQDANPENNRTCIGTPVVPPLTGSICGVKFDDKNGNGKQDPGETGLPGWTIVLTDGDGNFVASVVTGPNGEYCFKGLPMGAYSVSEVNQVGWMQIYPAAAGGAHAVTLTPKEPHLRPLDFGNQVDKTPGEICGVKFFDVNGNGVRDPGEPGLPGWTIQMLDSAGNVVASVVSTQQGRFCFKEIKQGTYTFAEVMQANWTQTYPAAPGTYTVTVQGGASSQMLLFGNTAKPQDDPCCLSFRFRAGRADQFGTSDGLEASSPSAALVAAYPFPQSLYFDSAVMDRFFLHTFTLPEGNCISSARLEVMARPLGNSSTVRNDTIGLLFAGVAGSPTWSSYFGSGQSSPGLLSSPWSMTNFGAGQLMTLDLGSLGLLSTLNSERFLDMVVQDDTAIDYMVLTVEFCECATDDGHGGPGKPDTAAPAAPKR